MNDSVKKALLTTLALALLVGGALAQSDAELPDGELNCVVMADILWLSADSPFFRQPESPWQTVHEYFAEFFNAYDCPPLKDRQSRIYSDLPTVSLPGIGAPSQAPEYAHISYPQPVAVVRGWDAQLLYRVSPAAG